MAGRLPWRNMSSIWLNFTKEWLSNMCLEVSAPSLIQISEDYFSSWQPYSTRFAEHVAIKTVSVWHDVCLPKTSKEKPWVAGLCGVLSNMADWANNWTKWGIPSLQNRFQLFEGKPVRAHRHCWRENCGDTANNRGFCSVFLWNPLISAASESVWDLPVAMPGSRPIEAAATVCLVLHHEMAWVVGRVAAIFRKWTIILFQRKLLEKCKQCRNDYVL
jgi:hypothetical protein